MTEDYKEQLLNYVTGNLETTSPTTDEIFEETNEIPRNKWVYKYSPQGWNKLNIEGFIEPNENTSNLGILYGGYQVYNSTEYRGFIILTDINFNPIKYIEEFDSGTKLRYIQCMIQGDDNLFYAIDDTEMSYKNYNIYSTQKRFIMLNNFSIQVDGEYKVRLRTSYILNGTNYQNFYCDNIYKEPNASHFVFTGKYAYDSSSWAIRIKAIEVKINVGQPNEWNYYQVNDSEYALTDFVSFNSSGESKIQFISVGSSNYYLYLESKGYSQNLLNQSTLHTFNYRMHVNTLDNQGLFMDENNVYVVIDNQNLQIWNPGGSDIPIDRHVGLFHYNFSNSTFETLYDHFLGTTTTPINQERIQVSKNQSKLYIAFYNNIDNNNLTADYHIQRYDGIWNPILIGENKPLYYETRKFYVKLNYNLLQYNLFNGEMAATAGGKPIWYFVNVKEIYNPNQYNGAPYIDINVLNPKYSNLYSNGSLVFSRNLYNISKQNNMTMSSVEIPNNYLNNTTITQNDLISETNLQMNTDLTNWTKNIYEVVDLNFLNTISVIDQDTNTPYLDSAIRINNAITDINDYSNMTCNKVRINYVDTTTKTFPISWEEIDSTHKQTEFSIYVDKPIISIDFISNDTNTIYCSKQLEVEVGNYYTINEKIKVGD